MLIEHLIYSLSLALIVGVIYNQYTHRNPAWLIVVAAYLPDTDYIIQTAWYEIWKATTILLPTRIRHGDFHNIMAIILLSIIGAYIYQKYYNGIFKDGLICLSVGGFFHFICDMIVYDGMYHPYFPFSRGLSTWNIIHESRSLFGIGDAIIILWGVTLVTVTFMIKYAIEGDDGMIQLTNQVKKAQSLLVSTVVTFLKI